MFWARIRKPKDFEVTSATLPSIISVFNCVLKRM